MAHESEIHTITHDRRIIIIPTNFRKLKIILFYNHKSINNHQSSSLYIFYSFSSIGTCKFTLGISNFSKN